MISPSRHDDGRCALTQEPCDPRKRCWLPVSIGTAVTLAALFTVWALGWINPQRTANATLAPKGLSVNCLLFAPDSKHLIVGSRSMTPDGLSPKYAESELSVWDYNNKTKLHSIITPQWVRALSLSKKGDLLGVAIGSPKEQTPNWVMEGKPREIRLYSFPDMKEVAKVESERYINSLSLSPDGKWLAASSMSDTFRGPAEVKVWDVATLKVKYTINDLRVEHTVVQFSPDGKTLAMADGGAIQKKQARPIIRIHETETGKKERDFDPGTTPFDPRSFDLRFTPDGKKLIASALIYIHVVDLATGNADKLGDKLRTGYRKIATTSDGKWLVVSEPAPEPRRQSYIRIWDVETNKKREEWIPKHGLGPIAISVDKKTLAIGGDQVYLYDLTGK